MTVIVFCGPTIPADSVLRVLDADVRPPAQRGDLLGAARDRPDAIGLVDGYFDRVPSVWHKEILWAMAEGIHVFGAASLGALRAAELAPFGMVGVGAIFEAFASGELEDDDEVAVAHGDAESGYRPGSDAMVNIRWTLRAAQGQGVVGAATRAVLEARAKAMPYDRRDLRAVLASGATTGLPQTEVTALERWLSAGHVDQKRADAVAMLENIAASQRAGWPRKTVEFQLARTEGFETLRATVEWERAGRGRPRAEDLADELRARGMHGRTVDGALARLLAQDRLERAGVALNARAVEAWIDEFRRQRGLFSQESFDAWLADAGLEGEATEAFFRREAVVQATRAELTNAAGQAVEDELRARGQLRSVRAAAEEKRALLDQPGLGAPKLADAAMSEDELWTWFFQRQLGLPVPASIAAYAAGEGTTADDLRASALRALLFERRIPAEERSSR